MSVHRHFVSTIDQPLCTSSVRAANIDALKTIKESYTVEVSFGSGEGEGQIAPYGPDAAFATKYPELATDVADAMAAMMHHRDNEAIAQFSAILRIPDLPVSMSNPVRLNRALLYARNLRTDEALADLKTALAVAPGDVRLLDMRALVWFDRADFARALADCNAVIAARPADIPALRLRGNIAMETGKYEDAIHDYTGELAVTRDTGALELRAIANHRLGRETDAGADIDLAVQAGVKEARQIYQAIIYPSAAPDGLTAQAPAAVTDIRPVGSAGTLSAANSHGAAYPTLSVLLGEEGQVNVGFTVDANGNVSDPRIVESSGFATLDSAALAAVRSWRYNPVRLGGRAIAINTTAQVRWALQ
jgi:TonB family protein